MNKDRVIDSRATEAGKAIRRRRECKACGQRYTTKERYFDGSIALIALTAKALGQDDVWALRELVNSYFGLSL